MAEGRQGLVVEARLDELARVAAWAEAFTAPLHLPSSTEYAIQLCLEEIVSNIIRHGLAEHAGPCAAPTIALSLGLAGDDIAATIEDCGVAFDPTAIAEPARPSTIEEAVIGGQGINLVMKFTQGMSYERVGGINRLTLRFRLQES